MANPTALSPLPPLPAGGSTPSLASPSPWASFTLASRDSPRCSARAAAVRNSRGGMLGCGARERARSGRGPCFTSRMWKSADTVISSAIQQKARK
jgi:hypothetical protein